MRHLLGVRPSARAVLRQPAVLCLLVLLAAAPAFAAWWGEDSGAPLRLRIAGLAMAVAVAMVWEDRTTVVAAATPVGAPAVQRGRAVVVVALAAAAWLLGALAVEAVTGTAVPAGLALEAAALAAVLTAVVGHVARGRLGEPVLGYPLPALLVLLVVVVRLPARWRLLVEGPDDPAWSVVQQRWAVLLVVALLAVAWAGRDPARR